ncbi:MAG: hypothetical protein NTX86_02010 [Candidatus Dependentiae bacterium]|nr:hypothetical protein [Candidatus Dependentiae bacterium]
MMIKKTGIMALLLSSMVPVFGINNDVLLPRVANEKKIELVYPQHSVIARHKESIQTSLGRAQLVRYGIYGVSAIVALAASYNLLKWCGFVGENTSSSACTLTPAVMKTLTPEGLKDYDAKFYPSFFSWRGLHHLRSHITNCVIGGFSGVVGTSLAQRVGEPVYAQVFNPGSIAWFVQEKTTLMPTFEEFKEYVDALNNVQTPVIDKAMYRNLMMVSANNLVAQLERVMGFIAYKNGTWDDQKAIDEVNFLSDYIFDVTKVFCIKVDTALQNDDLNVNQLAVTLSSFKSEIHRLMNSFSRIETAQEL